MAGPVAESFVSPAALSAVGKMIENPSPAQAKPTRAAAGCATARDIPSPAAEMAAPARTSATGPKRAVTRSPRRRPATMAAEQDAEGDHLEPGQRPRRPGERRLPAFSSVLVRGQHPQVREGEGCQRQSG